MAAADGPPPPLLVLLGRGTAVATVRRAGCVASSETAAGGGGGGGGAAAAAASMATAWLPWPGNATAKPASALRCGKFSRREVSALRADCPSRHPCRRDATTAMAAKQRSAQLLRCRPGSSGAALARAVLLLPLWGRLRHLLRLCG